MTCNYLIIIIIIIIIINTHADYVGRRWSAWVGRSRPSVCLYLSVCLSVYLFVCPQYNSKTNDPKVFKLDQYREWPWNIPEVARFRGWKVKDQG